MGLLIYWEERTIYKFYKQEQKKKKKEMVYQNTEKDKMYILRVYFICYVTYVLATSLEYEKC